MAPAAKSFSFSNTRGVLRDGPHSEWADDFVNWAHGAAGASRKSDLQPLLDPDRTLASPYAARAYRSARSRAVSKSCQSRQQNRQLYRF